MRPTSFTARAAAIIVILLGVIGPALGAALPLTLVSKTSPITRSTLATVTVKTVPGATCSILITYKSKTSTARGVRTRPTADADGQVSWAWKMGSTTTPGTWPIVVTCLKGTDTGELQTTFEVMKSR